MGFQKGRKASLASIGKNTCEDSCSRSRVAVPFIERIFFPYDKKVLGKFPFRLLVLAQGSISLVSELLIGLASSYSSDGKLVQKALHGLSWAQITVRKQRNMPISEFPHFVASISAIQSLRLSAVKMAASEERAYSSSSSQGY
ncbi:hypothetical protein M9H77_23539 [Catharanthus roseus]|uniref:Uncharacterized protein n=1 Tax=Catharanthus roseus TaxID=4058 RepID=A0ACC0AXN6_CATRO|nr:hypothetical protein M9H77_23539 [Catharanthus roseus]